MPGNDGDRPRFDRVITSYSIHYTKLYDFRELSQEAIRSARQALEVRDQVQEEIVSCLDALAEEPSELDAFDRDFFDSYEMSYSMTLAYPREFFEQAAEKEGIEHRGVV